MTEEVITMWCELVLKIAATGREDLLERILVKTDNFATITRVVTASLAVPGSLLEQSFELLTKSLGCSSRGDWETLVLTLIKEVHKKCVSH